MKTVLECPSCGEIEFRELPVNEHNPIVEYGCDNCGHYETFPNYIPVMLRRQAS